MSVDLPFERAVPGIVASVVFLVCRANERPLGGRLLMVQYFDASSLLKFLA
jgi:hypothetical protein